MLPTRIQLSKSPKILIVEDDGDQRRLMVKLIRASLDCEILEAADGLEAAEIMLRDKQAPDLILLDLMLPYLSGPEFLAIVRGRPEFDHVPVIVCTAVAETSEIRGKISHRIQGYVVKPVSKDILLEKLLAALHDIKIRVDYHG